ncbi:glycosylhydrolase-like jelly roll fold domain-containing protein [Micromonospora sicca]|uniref:glycosylhydrolase-like jelly roll fold domain-containing protein n=1 Tax=Micromonospora sicca TaxID=2202420 RepID=UPI0013751A6E|nr:glycosylhydrolase-like jelly roll fold domain-containing protein [Micromonospora sp. 4G51]
MAGPHNSKHFAHRGRHLSKVVGVLTALLIVAASPLQALARSDQPAQVGTRQAETEAGAALSAARFENPAGDSKPTMLWFWNGTITEDLVDRQLADMRSEGLSEVVIFPDATSSLNPAFFTEGWFAMVGHALREAQRTGMKVWLYNDRSFPSGRAAGYVVNGGTIGDRVYEPHPELRAQSIARSELEASGPRSFDVRGRFPGLIPAALSVSDGRLKVDGGYVTLLGRGSDWTDYTFSFDAQPLQTASLGGRSYAQAGWVYRAQDTANGYMYLLGNYPHAGAAGGNLTKIIYKNGAYVSTRVMRLPFNVVSGRSYHVETRVEGDHVVTSIDGMVVDETTDATYAHGTIGFREATTQHESATFDNLRVTAPDGTTLHSQTFDSESALSDFATPAPADNVVAVAALPVRDGKPDLAGLVDLTDRFRAGTPWSVPEGDYQVEYYLHHARTDFGGDGYLNLFDEEAIRRYIQVVHDEYYRRFAWAFDAGVVRGLWDDEPRIATGYGAEPSWSDLVGRNLAHAGATPAQALAATFGDYGPAGSRLRGVLSNAASDALAQAYYKQQGDWARAHGTQIISNPLSDDRPPAWMLRETGDIHKDNQWIQVPGGDAISGRVAPGLRNLVPRYITSDGHQQGASRILHENLGAYGWGVTPQLARYVNGAMGVRGVNLTVLHAYWSNPDSVRYPPSLQPTNPWWNSMDGVVDWTGRVMELTRGQANAPTALLHPQTAAQAWQRTETGDALDNEFRTVTYAMEDAQVDFDILDEAYLNGDPAMNRQAVVSDRALTVGQQSYRVVVVPPAPTMSVKAVARLDELARAGGTVIAYGELPVHEADGQDEALRTALIRLFGTDPARPQPTDHRVGSGHAEFVSTTTDLRRALDGARAPAAQLQPASPDTRVLRVKHGPDQVFILMNEGTKAVDTTAAFPIMGTPEIWDPDDGSHRVATRFDATPGSQATSVPLHLEPTKALAVVFRGQPPAPHLVQSPFEASSVSTTDRDTLQATVIADRPGDFTLVGAEGPRRYTGSLHVEGSFAPIALDGPWRFRFDQPDAQWTERPLGSWTQVDRSYSGDATYEKNVSLSAQDLASGRRLILDLGSVRDVAHVAVNGTQAGRLMWEPYRLDVTDLLHVGENRIDVTVANTPANAHGAGQQSGLLGPVVLRPQQETTVQLN